MNSHRFVDVQVGRWFIIIFVLICFQATAPTLLSAPNKSSTNFVVQTYDGLELPAQVTHTSAPFKKLLIFIHGSTPYDEFGHIGPGWDDKGQIIKQKNAFYLRFLEVLPTKGYTVATMAKRSFVYPHRIPRPSLDELALDVQFLVWELKKKELLRSEDDLVVVGYSEGSIVASKLLGLMRKQPAACVLLGSASNAFNYKTQSWRDWHMTKIYKEKKNWTDEQLETEFKKFGALMMNLLEMDENTFESEYKHSKPFGFGFAPWESYHIDKEGMFYDPSANLLASNIPILICIGENDIAMPRVLAERTYDRLRENGYEKATFTVIEDEVHQYRKYDVFAIMNAWIESGGTTTDYVLTQVDKDHIERYAEIDGITNSINSLPYGGGEPEEALACFHKAQALQLGEPHPWYKLGLVLFADGNNEEALFSFEQASDTTFIAHFAAMVWMGHINDLQNNRTQAVEWYKKAMDAYPGFPAQHDNWNMKIDQTWIEERLKTPFRGIEEEQD